MQFGLCGRSAKVCCYQFVNWLSPCNSTMMLSAVSVLMAAATVAQVTPPSDPHNCAPNCTGPPKPLVRGVPPHTQSECQHGFAAPFTDFAKLVLLVHTQSHNIY